MNEFHVNRRWQLTLHLNFLKMAFSREASKQKRVPLEEIAKKENVAV